MVSCKLFLLHPFILLGFLCMQSTCNIASAKFSRFIMPGGWRQPAAIISSSTMVEPITDMVITSSKVAKPTKPSELTDQQTPNQLLISFNRARTPNDLQRLMRKVLARFGAAPKIVKNTIPAASLAEVNDYTRSVAQRFTDRDHIKVLERGNLAEDNIRYASEREVRVRKLWEKVTGQSLPSHGEYSLLFDAGNVKGDDVAQAEKRLVPGGPDPLHHSSDPLSP